MQHSIIIYGDLFLAVQLLWNTYLIFLAAHMMQYHLSLRKWMILSATMSIGSVLAICYLKWRWMILIPEWLMILFVTKSKKMCLALFLVSVFAGGLWMLMPESGKLFVAVATIAGMLYQKYIPKSNLYTVECSNHGKKVKMKALYDTGNSLYLANGDQMVSLISYEAIQPIFDWDQVENPQIVSFSSVGNKEGLLFAVPIDSFIILEKNIERKHPYIGIVEQKLSTDDQYQMILHKDIFHGREW